MPSCRLAALQCPDGAPPPCRSTRTVAAPAAPPNSVAVLYFDNLSRDTADAYLADGLTDEITTRLGQVARLTVTSRTTMQRYRGQAGDPAALARTLRVAHLVNGTIRRGPGRLRVGVELLRARDGVQLWTETYDRTDGDVLAIEEDVARAVATAIAGRLLPDERATLTARTTHNPAAHDRVMRGNFLIARRTEPDALRAIAEYQAAIQLDPSYTDAWALMAFGYALFNNWDWRLPGVSSDSVVELAKSAARRALALDSTSAVAWLAQGSALAESNAMSLDGAVPAYQRALAIDPRLAEVHHTLGTALLRLDDAPGGAASLRRSLAIDPARPITLAWLGLAMLHERRLADARGWFDSAVAVAPAFPYALTGRAGVRALQGDAAGAVRDAADGLRTSRGDTIGALAVLAFAHAYAGDSADARVIIRAITDDPTATYFEASIWLAGAQLRLGDRDGALRSLERAKRSSFLRFLLGYPFLDPIRSEPRFQRVVAEVAR